ncbi:MAG: D-cysteine desulfhydrase family protein [Planctomycetota bacterium]|nr:D-cysteine desulfhydrase family protein [Planctomycetota bacterium]
MASPPPRVSLATLPTRLERLDRTSALLGLDLWVKRDDLTGAALSGNKVRKLEYLCGEARSPAIDADTLITCGAVTSNHCRATAVAAATLGLSSHLLLRGSEPAVPDGNLLLGRLVGAETTFIDPVAWPERAERMEAIAVALRAQGRRPYVIPEGGSNAVGAWGYREAARELREQAERLGLDLAQVWHATGSGGTTAGLALGFAGTSVEVCGVAVCDDAAYFDAVIEGLVAPQDPRARWRIVDGYQGAGYGRTTPEDIAFYGYVAKREGLILDPVYTGKAFRALVLEAAAGRVPRDRSVVFLHTGGIYGLFSFAEAFASPS